LRAKSGKQRETVEATAAWAFSHPPPRQWVAMFLGDDPCHREVAAYNAAFWARVCAVQGSMSGFTPVLLEGWRCRRRHRGVALQRIGCQSSISLQYPPTGICPTAEAVRVWIRLPVAASRSEIPTIQADARYVRARHRLPQHICGRAEQELTTACSKLAA